MKRLLVMMSAALVLGAAYVGWTWFQRHESDVRMAHNQAARHRAARPVENRGAGARVLAFYARSGEVFEGDRNLVCYGVENARTVRMEPPVEELTPVLTRCFWTEPHDDTTYRLIAEGFDGSEAAAEFTVRVKPPPPYINFVAVSDGEIRRGQPVTMCYGVRHAHSVRLDPIGWHLAPSEKNCAKFFPAATMKYTLLVSGAGGMTDRERFTIKVK